MVAPLYILFPLVLLVITRAESLPKLDDTESVKKDDFVDPNDMFGFEPVRPTKLTNKKKSVIEETISEENAGVSMKTESIKEKPASSYRSDVKNEKVCPALISDRPFYKQHIRSLLNHLTRKTDTDETRDEISYEMIVTLSKSEHGILQRFVDTESGHIQDVNSILGQMIRQSRTLEDVFVSRWKFEDIFFGLQFKLMQEMLVIIVLVICAIYVGSKVQLSWRRLFGQIVMISFIISIPWNWFHLYKVAVAKRQSEVIKGIPEECRPNDMSWQKSILGYFDSFFTVNKGTCGEYHEKLLVDPFWEVSPPQAVAVTVTKFILEPVTHIGESISKFFRSILLHVPPVMYPVVITCTLVSLFFLLLLLFGYRIRLPFFMGVIEPAKQQNLADERIKAIESKQIEIVEILRAQQQLPRISSQEALPTPSIQSRSTVEDIGPIVKKVVTEIRQQNLIDKISDSCPPHLECDDKKPSVVKNTDNKSDKDENKSNTVTNNGKSIDSVGAGAGDSGDLEQFSLKD